MLQIPEEKLPEEELKKHLETVQRMKEGKEGITWDEFKKKAGWHYFAVLVFAILILGCAGTGSREEIAEAQYAFNKTVTFKTGPVAGAREIIFGVVSYKNDYDKVSFVFKGSKKTYNAKGALAKEEAAIANYTFEYEGQKPVYIREVKGLSLEDLQYSILFVNYTNLAKDDPSIVVLSEKKALEGDCPSSASFGVRYELKLLTGNANFEPVLASVIECAGKHYYNSDQTYRNIQLLKMESVGQMRTNGFDAEQKITSLKLGLIE